MAQLKCRTIAASAIVAVLTVASAVHGAEIQMANVGGDGESAGSFEFKVVPPPTQDIDITCTSSNSAQFPCCNGGNSWTFPAERIYAKGGSLQNYDNTTQGVVVTCTSSVMGCASSLELMTATKTTGLSFTTTCLTAAPVLPTTTPVPATPAPRAATPAPGTPNPPATTPVPVVPTPLPQALTDVAVFVLNVNLDAFDETAFKSTVATAVGVASDRVIVVSATAVSGFSLSVVVYFTSVADVTAPTNTQLVVLLLVSANTPGTALSSTYSVQSATRQQIAVDTSATSSVKDQMTRLVILLCGLLSVALIV